MAGDRAHQRKQQSKIPPEARRLIDFLNSRRRGEKPDGLRDTDAAGAGIDAVIGSLVADLQALVQKGQFNRVRLCANEPCSHAFYDATRSQTQRWHSYAVCGNRSNVAAYRRRGDRA